MKTARWLLPFTSGVDMLAIDYVVRLAGSTGAMLIPVSLVCAPPEGARLEHIQQSKDFLEAVQHKAARYGVAVERFEVFTPNVLQSIRTLVYEMCCDGIVLLTSGEQTRLMQDEEIKQLLVEPPTALVLIRLPGYSISPPDSRWLLSRWHRYKMRQL
ncbi:MAG TPA: hypothetical protein VFQ36_20815 [Ktedonobacteraceae bacterium]|nr:hypothetical protein [Ktedonobacteraceae bacterium]